MKVYIKRGKLNYKEKRMVSKLESIVNTVLEKKPELAENFRPATNFDELKAMYDNYTAQDVEFIEINKNNSPGSEASSDIPEEEDDDSFTDDEETKEGDLEELNDNFETNNKTMNTNSNVNLDDDQIVETKIDPFNKEAKIVRPYVLEGGDLEETPVINSGRSSFDEPTNFGEAFSLPEDETFESPESSSFGGQKQASYQEPIREENYGGGQPSQSINRDFDDMSSAKKKKSTKKFAKYIVETVCMLAEKGFVWYANKDINEAKLLEYEMNGEIDLDLMITLDEGQQGTIKDFFGLQCYKAEELSKISEEEKSDLTDSLAEVLMEKGFAPTPSQELLMVAAKILGKQALTLFTLKTQSNLVLAQLRAMKQEEIAETEIAFAEPPMPTQAPEQTYTFERQAEREERKKSERQATEKMSVSEEVAVVQKVTENDQLALLESADPLNEIPTIE